jgi:4-amino-4-deoxy-L-arabinose transferase-like glycosyltransferase
MKRVDAGIAVSLFFVSLVLYLRTLAPSLLFGDSAEFQTIAYTLGMGHPTGYPVYILLAKLFTFLPFGDVAYRVNLLSAVAAALTVSLVYLILRKLGTWQISAVLSVFFLIFSELFWKHASIAEIYTVSAVCLALIFYCVLTWKESGNSRWLFTAGLFGGLSLGIHTTVALSGIAIFVYLVLSTHQRADWIQASLGTAIGIAIFLSSFLFLDHLNASAGYYNTVVNHALSVWDMTPADFDSPFERLAFIYFPPQFSGQLLAVSSEVITERLMGFFSGASWNISIALIGMVSLFISRKNSRPRWREGILLVTAFFTFLLFAASYDVYDYYVFYIPAILVLVIAIGLGFDAIAEMLSATPKIPAFIPGILVGVLIVTNLWFSFPDALSSWKNRTPPFTNDNEVLLFAFPDTRRIEAESILDDIEDNAIIFTDWDAAYNFYYVAHVLQGRKEMDFHETYPQEGMHGLADSTLAYIAANIASRPIYFTESPSELAALYRITRAGSGLFRIAER